MEYKVKEVEAEVSPRGGGERRAGICYHSPGREPRAEPDDSMGIREYVHGIWRISPPSDPPRACCMIPVC